MIPTPIQPQSQDPEVLKARIDEASAKLIALDATRDANLATVAANYAQQKSIFLKQKNDAQAKLDEATKS
jgi:hypothetical protein